MSKEYDSETDPEREKACYDADLAANAKMLARQTDMAREAENQAASLRAQLALAVKALEAIVANDGGSVWRSSDIARQALAALSSTKGGRG